MLKLSKNAHISAKLVVHVEVVKQVGSAMQIRCKYPLCTPDLLIRRASMAWGPLSAVGRWKRGVWPVFVFCETPLDIFLSQKTLNFSTKVIIFVVIDSFLDHAFGGHMLFSAKVLSTSHSCHCFFV